MLREDQFLIALAILNVVVYSFWTYQASHLFGLMAVA